ncbi:MAG: methylated-DNA--[protein]-cysteine S-methyltransferase [Chloroflexota bacterium]
METSFYGYYDSVIGLVEIGGTEEAVNTLYFVEKRRDEVASSPPIEAAVEQLDAYFQSGRRAFDLPLKMRGTDFQKRVWNQLLSVDYGTTVSYLDIANALDHPKAVRAVGAANGQNPISIIVPCHRIIGSNGRLTGYGGGLWRKEWLLKHEGALLA